MGSTGADGSLAGAELADEAEAFAESGKSVIEY